MTVAEVGAVAGAVIGAGPSAVAGGELRFFEHVRSSGAVAAISTGIRRRTCAGRPDPEAAEDNDG
jgi:hypothetical protein